MRPIDRQAMALVIVTLIADQASKQFLLGYLMKVLVMGGAIGNVIDRARWGAVFDFADFHIGHWHWPAFNVADSAIVVGVALMLIDSLVGEKQRAP